MEWTFERAMPAALILVPALVCWWFGRRTAARLHQGRHPETRLTSAAQVALLTNGPIRVAETTVASMLEREQLRADSAGRLYRTPTQPSDALSREAAELTGTGAGIATVLRGLVGGDTVRELVEDLTKRGLLVDGQALQRAWKWTAIGEAVLAATRQARAAVAGTGVAGGSAGAAGYWGAGAGCGSGRGGGNS